MLARLAETLPAGDYLYEPKWDGFRAIVFRGGNNLYIQSRDSRPLDRYFPDLHDALLERLPENCVVDGEIVIASAKGLDFDALQLRLHPAESRVARLARETPASFVAFDLLAAGGRSLLQSPQAERRKELEKLLARAKPPLFVTPVTRDRDLALDWLTRFEGAGLDGVMAKPDDAPYQPGKRAMIKVKHSRTADCVVAGFRWHKSGKDAVGSLLLGLYNDQGLLDHVGFTSSISADDRPALTRRLERLIAPPGFTGDRPGAPSRWSTERSTQWEPLRPKLVVEVLFDHVTAGRFRHGTRLLRWRPDKAPRQCTFEQLKPPAAVERLSAQLSAA